MSPHFTKKKKYSKMSPHFTLIRTTDISSYKNESSFLTDVVFIHFTNDGHTHLEMSPHFTNNNHTLDFKMSPHFTYILQTNPRMKMSPHF